MRQSPFFVFCFFTGFVLLLRWSSFLPSVLEHDESTYIVIAGELLRGEVYLRESVDTKPIGIFWIYQCLLLLTGGSIFWLRFTVSILVAATAYGWFIVCRQATGSPKVGFMAGLGYCLLSSTFKKYGISPNTELFVNFFYRRGLGVYGRAAVEGWAPGGFFNL
ncbi:MAG: hypothetical protein HC821_01710 [Lewinella sp.]|nr:hypothetical protein [Lewinella sp.]